MSKEITRSESLLKQGMNCSNQENYESAIDFFNEAIKENPNYSAAYFERAAAYYFCDDYNHAIADYNEAIRISPNKYNYYYNRAIAYKDKGENILAIKDLTTSIKLNEYDIEDYICNFNTLLASFNEAELKTLDLTDLNLCGEELQGFEITKINLAGSILIDTKINGTPITNYPANTICTLKQLDETIDDIIKNDTAISGVQIRNLMASAQYCNYGVDVKTQVSLVNYCKTLSQQYPYFSASNEARTTIEKDLDKAYNNYFADTFPKLLTDFLPRVLINLTTSYLAKPTDFDELQSWYAKIYVSVPELKATEQEKRLIENILKKEAELEASGNTHVNRLLQERRDSDEKKFIEQGR